MTLSNALINENHHVLLEISLDFVLNGPVNSSTCSAAYVRQWTGSLLLQIMACHLFGASHYLNQCWVIVNWTLKNKRQWNFNQNRKLFIQENTYENIVCEMAAILSRGRWVKSKLTLVQTSDNDWMLSWQQAIVRTNNGLGNLHIYVSLSLDDLTHWGWVTHICVVELGHHWFR